MRGEGFQVSIHVKPMRSHGFQVSNHGIHDCAWIVAIWNMSNPYAKPVLAIQVFVFEKYHVYFGFGFG